MSDPRFIKYKLVQLLDAASDFKNYLRAYISKCVFYTGYTRAERSKQCELRLRERIVPLADFGPLSTHRFTKYKPV